MNISRRKFLKGAALAAVFPLIYQGKLFGAGHSAPNSRCNLGVIGVGKMADSHLNGLTDMPNVRVCALADVDDKRLKFWSEKIVRKYTQKGFDFDKPKCYKDFRELLADPSIDAVYITTPDHWHAIISILAARAGKAIYCEKPMTFTIEEARKVTKAVQEAGVVFQVGSQQRSGESFRRAAQLAKNGYLGEIKNVWCRLNYNLSSTRNWKYEDVPAGVDWDMWCGPAPYNPYSQQLLPMLSDNHPDPYSEHGFPAWRDHLDYGNSNQADFGAHHYDIAMWGLGLDGKGPKRVVVMDNANLPGEPGKRQYYYETESGAKIMKGNPSKDVCPLDYAVIFEGTEGVAAADRGPFWANKKYFYDILIGDDDQVYRKAPGGSHRDCFFNAVFNGSPVTAPVEGGRSSAELSIMGNIAYRLGRTLEWDWKKGEFVNDPEANKFISRPNRGQWALI
ncbi:MAG: Gfo/Idh/MocA family oxidoreductase [Opitutales bacterium]|nr:Gfo/Idh/MocA family oxidoreductase [Opitutales bacterium]